MASVLPYDDHIAMRIALIILGLTLVACVLAAAQATPPSPDSLFTITVTDENGIAVTGARVSLQSPSVATLHCETDFSGRCRFAGITPGTYQLRVEKEGFYVLVHPQVEVRPPTAGQSGGLDVALSRQQEVREVVNVQESPPAIDPAQIAAQQSLSGLDVINIPYPTTSDYRNVLNFIPGVVQD